ncbi:hypothetical protein CBR_g52225 [Chara braunii]|uniref:Uncharacterized protein n=1 Tax=Chara braunii TaxID=69332 RepID=A0A388MA50_CHABU|nr:hypothetical protein CBR_g52225 [Chara braunii]|eukprot:GBG91339.1 hypothetical protein CBR_g52225 [Chara braunii]
MRHGVAVLNRVAVETAIVDAETESSIRFASKEDGCTPQGVAGFNETQSQELLKLTLEFGGLEDRESVGRLVVNTIVRYKLDGVLDVAHRWNAGIRERRWENIVVLSNEVTDCGVQVVVDGLAEVEVVAMVTLWRQRGTSVLLTILERAEAAREVAALLRGTVGATAERGTALGSVVRGEEGVTGTLGLGGGCGVKTDPHPLMVPGGLVSLRGRCELVPPELGAVLERKAGQETIDKGSLGEERHVTNEAGVLKDLDVAIQIGSATRAGPACSDDTLEGVSHVISGSEAILEERLEIHEGQSPTLTKGVSVEILPGVERTATQARGEVTHPRVGCGAHELERAGGRLQPPRHAYACTVIQSNV